MTRSLPRIGQTDWGKRLRGVKQPSSSPYKVKMTLTDRKKDGLHFLVP